MCGIAGIFIKDVKKYENIILKNLSKLERRGPDNLNYVFINEDIAFLHTRLSIQGIGEIGNQPIKSISKRWLMTFNGEIYNEKLLKQNLLNIGVEVNMFRNTDTFSLIEHIDNFGIEKTLSQVSGMYSIALWDDKYKKIYLIRDRVGEKPLYYYFDKEIFFFGSITSLFSELKINKTLDHNSIVNFLNYSYIPNNYSIYSEMKKVEPSSIVSFCTISKKIIQKKYTTIKYKKISNPKLNSLESYLENAVKEQLISDVEIGTFLSGGLDSSLVSFFASKYSTQKIKSFSIGFEDKKFNEASFAKKVANLIGTDHHELVLSNRELLDYALLIPKVYDEPFADSSQIPMIALTNLASNHVKVCLSGDGADEAFLGYPRYEYIKRISKFYSYFPYSFRKKIFKTLGFLKFSTLEKIYKFLSLFLPKNLKNRNFEFYYDKILSSLICSNIDELNNNLVSFFNQYSHDIVKSNSTSHTLKDVTDYDIANYLPNDILVKSDRASMYYSLENRSPFLNKEVMNYSRNKILQNKIELKKILSKYLPKELVYRKKMGFSVPLSAILKNEFRDLSFDMLQVVKNKNFNFLNHSSLDNIYKDHITNKKQNTHLVWNITVLGMWLTHYD